MKTYPTQPEVNNLVLSALNVEVQLKAGQSTYDVNEPNLQEKNIVGLFMRGPVAGRKTKNNIAFPAANVFQCGFLTIKDNMTEVINKFPIENLIALPSEYVKVHLPNGIKINDMQLMFSDAATPQTSTAIEIIFIVESTC